VRVTLAHATPLADFTRVDPRAIALLGDRWARLHRVLPLRLEGGELVVATSDPLDCDAEAAVGFATGHRVRWEVAPAQELLRHIDRWYPDASMRRDGSLPPVEVQHLVFGAESAGGGASGEQGASVLLLVDQLLADGIAAGASDIHLEPEEQGLAVRHRVDGVLRQVRVLPRSVAPALVSRIKILSGLDIADRLRPQDGRARVAVSGAIVDLRVSTLPASHGEKVVVRVLDGSAGLRTLDAIGFADRELRRIRALLEQREGLILVTGPTGSGKTTTLYAALREVHARGVNIVTVEDPIEYRLAGIVQVQVHERAGLTFSAALRSIMRQDPDVILVGEIRDRETAEIAIQASLTGHLVLSTLHTNDAASAVTRLIDIGVASYQIATAVKGVIAQRLLRRSCPDCRAAGCPCCDGTGHRGRLAVAEIMVTSPELERRIAAGAPTESIAESAREGGCVMLWDAGLELVRRGATTIEELRRVAAAPARVVAEGRPAGLEVPVTAGDSGAAARSAGGAPGGEPSSATADRGSAGSGIGGGVEGAVGCRDAPGLRPPPHAAHMATISIGTIDVYLVAPGSAGWRVLVLQRGHETRCPTSWETVHGHIEAGERPEEAAVREVREETGLAVERLYNVTVQPFYLHRTGTVELAVVFAAFVRHTEAVTLGSEHMAFEWLSPDAALQRLAWPRERVALSEALQLLAGGDAGAVEDVLRVY
jgi:type II secretory ATPase GspE/PulE/Tfp pilus assembly ATPase PilB-like protein/8-oxo-dGTP pyrophosphatase MutT (NUDIX family)